MGKHLQHLIFCFVSILFCCGCRQDLLDTAPIIERDKEIICKKSAKDRCAIRSQLQVLADETFSPKNTSGLHYACLLDVGEDALLTRIHMIRAARNSIDLQTFIWDDDEVGQLLFMELVGAARRGVHVRLILDEVGTFVTPSVIAAMATSHENLDIRLFNPVMGKGGESESPEIGSVVFDFKALNHRMHNKLIVVDNRIGIVGGRNIQDSYYDFGNKVNFKDLDLLVIGPAVIQMAESFEIFWNHDICPDVLRIVDVASAARKLQEEDYAKLFQSPELPELAGVREIAGAYSIIDQRTSMTLHTIQQVRYISDWPAKKKKTKDAQKWNSTEPLGQALRSARRSILLQTPYLVHDLKGAGDAKAFRKEHPDLELKLMTNSLASTDKFYVYAMCFKQRQFCLEGLKAEMFELKPIPGDVLAMIPRYAQIEKDFPKGETDFNENPSQLLPLDYEGPRLCLHSKYFIVDDSILFIGSHNFDPRAKNLNTENGIIFQDPELALALRSIFERDIAPQNSWVVAWQPKPPGVGNLSDLMARISSALPMFDLWPFRYSSNYELLEGKDPLPSTHPDFYDHYENVGPFPKMGISYQRLGVYFSKAFGGLAIPLM